MSDVPVKRCSVYFLEDTSVFIEGTDDEPSGPGGLSSKIQVRLSYESLDSLLGVVVILVLEQTKVVHGATFNSKEVFDLRYRMLPGIKSGRVFVAKARCLEVCMKDSCIQVMPTERMRDYWSHLPGYADSCDAVPDQVRDLLLEKLKQCG